MASRPTAAAYLDASAIVKLVVRETETDTLVEYLGDSRLVTSELAAVEVPRAAYLKTGVAEVIPHAEALLERFYLVVFDEHVRAVAARASPPELRSLDAVHLASALRVRDETDVLVVYDKRLAAAAGDAGLRVQAPAPVPE